MQQSIWQSQVRAFLGNALAVSLPFADLPTESREQVEAAARKLLDQGVKTAVLVKRGKNGSLLVTREDSIEQSIFKTNKVNVPSVASRNEPL